MMRRWFEIAGVLLLLTVAACNTVEGVGKDVESGGEGISDAARDVKQKI